MWQRLFKRKKNQSKEIDSAFIDRLVEIACPRIKLANDYLSVLMPDVLAACEKVHELENKLPLPLLLTPENWRYTPLLNLAFANPERMAELVGASEAIRHWFTEHPVADSAFAILAMTHEVAQRYGMEEQNGMVRQDVLQERLVLRDHIFGVPEASAKELISRAHFRAMEELAHHAARRIHGQETDRDLIEAEINTLRIALRLGGSTDPLNASAMQHQRIKRLAFLTDELAATRKSLEPDALLDIFVSVLRNPQSQLRFTETQLQVDLLGILRSAGENVHLIDLFEIEMIDKEPIRRVLLPVEIPRNLIRQQEIRTAEATLFHATIF